MNNQPNQKQMNIPALIYAIAGAAALAGMIFYMVPIQRTRCVFDMPFNFEIFWFPHVDFVRYVLPVINWIVFLLLFAWAVLSLLRVKPAGFVGLGAALLYSIMGICWMISALGSVTGFRLWFAGSIEFWTATAFLLLPMGLIMLVCAVMQIVMMKRVTLFFGKHNPMPMVLIDALAGVVGISSLFLVFLSLNPEFQKSVFQNFEITVQSVIAVFTLLGVLVWIALTFAGVKNRFIGGFVAGGLYLILALSIGIDMIGRIISMVSRGQPLIHMSITVAPIVMLFIGVLIVGCAVAQMIFLKKKSKAQPSAPAPQPPTPQYAPPQYPQYPV